MKSADLETPMICIRTFFCVCKFFKNPSWESCKFFLFLFYLFIFIIIKLSLSKKTHLFLPPMTNTDDQFQTDNHF